MPKIIKDDELQFDFSPGISISEILEQENTPPKHQKTRPFQPLPEIWDTEEGWVYERLKNGKRGRKIRKLFTRLRNYEISYWPPKIKDILYCEAKRWKAVQVLHNRRSKYNKIFSQVYKNAPFTCFKQQEDNYKWVVFPKHNDRTFGPSVSWEWWQNEEPPEMELKQDIGDAWFQYEKESRLTYQRVGYFEQLFSLAIETKYADMFYSGGKYAYSNTVVKLLINEREYLIGHKDRERFGIICYPENIITIKEENDSQNS